MKNFSIYYWQVGNSDVHIKFSNVQIFLVNKENGANAGKQASDFLFKTFENGEIFFYICLVNFIVGLISDNV